MAESVDDGDPVGPVCVVLRPEVYACHWRHVIDTTDGAETAVGGDGGGPGGVDTDMADAAAAVAGGGGVEVGETSSNPAALAAAPPAVNVVKRSKPRVTSGYLFLLTALELTGQPLPGEEMTDDDREGDDVEKKKKNTALGWCFFAACSYVG